MVRTSTLLLEIDNFGFGKKYSSGIIDLKSDVLARDSFQEVFELLSKISIPEVSEHTINNILNTARTI
jgi:hypothetical protein